MVVQLRNPEMIELLRADFQARAEPNFAWGNTCSMFQLLTGLRGFWPMSNADESGWTYDLSGQDRVLRYNGNPTFNADDLAPYIEFDGTGDFLSRPDEAGLDIRGTETSIVAAMRGLTIGGWFWIDSLAPGANDAFIGKWNTAGDQRSYLLYFNDTSNTACFDVSSLGTAASVITVTGSVMTAAGWHFIVARFDPSTEINIWVNNTEIVNAVGTPASLFNGTADFLVGAYDNGATGLLDGRASLCFLCGALLSDAVVKQLYEQTRAMYGVGL